LASAATFCSMKVIAAWILSSPDPLAARAKMALAVSPLQ